MQNGFRTTSDHNHVCDVSLVGLTSRLGSSRTVIAHTLRLFKQSRPKSHRIFHSSLGVRKSSTAAVVAESLRPNEKPLCAELRRSHGYLSELHTQDHEHASDEHFGVRVVTHPL